MRNRGCAHSCKNDMEVKTGSSEIIAGKNRQCIAQMPETPIPNLSQRMDAVILFSANSNEFLEYLVCINIHTKYTQSQHPIFSQQMRGKNYSETALFAEKFMFPSIVCTTPCRSSPESCRSDFTSYPSTTTSKTTLSSSTRIEAI